MKEKTILNNLGLLLDKIKEILDENNRDFIEYSLLVKYIIDNTELDPEFIRNAIEELLKVDFLILRDSKVKIKGYG